MTTLRVQVNEMAHIVLTEGAAHSPELAALALLAAGYTPRFVAAFLDEVMETARELQKPRVANVFTMPRRAQ